MSKCVCIYESSFIWEGGFQIVHIGKNVSVYMTVPLYGKVDVS